MQVKLGFDNGLAAQDIILYADSQYSADKMEILRTAILDGMEVKKVQALANAEVTKEQLCEIVTLFKKGVSIEQVNLLLKSKYFSFV